MAEVVVVGGYGQVGSACVRELLATTNAHVVIAGRNAQRAESAALASGERASGLYLDAGDRRTLPEALSRAAAIVLCCSGAPFALLDLALGAKVPLVSALPFPLEARARASLAERAWEAQVPLVLAAGAAPGLAGVAAEWLVRRFERLDEIRIVSSGPWSGSESARRDLASLRQQASRETRTRSRRARRHWSFPEPVGWLPLRAAPSLDLENFSAEHCVERVTHLEHDERLLARGVERALGRPEPAGFALCAEAFCSEEGELPDARIRFEAPSLPGAAAASLGVLVRAILAGDVPAGLQTPRESVNPGLFVDRLSKRGVRVRG